MEIDHVIVFCQSEAAREAEAFSRAGLFEGRPNTHRGQGTACRRFFLRNAYVELLWIRDEAEARRPGVGELGLWERATRPDACPFGIVLRPGLEPPRFPAWSYRPRYLPDGATIEVAAGVTLAEPAVFYLQFLRGAHSHPANPCSLAGVTVRGPGERTAVVRHLESRGLLRFETAAGHSMVLAIDGLPNLPLDLRPSAPVVLSAPAR
jgi:hypothetical protein